ncbi:MAG: hypothetical protein H6719_21255 [Sandaracinaceae bacterium]|nr:hypothetical protein [Sandaracinaceae bacterium]
MDRDSVSVLETRLAELEESRAEIDDEIASTKLLLEARAPSPRRGWVQWVWWIPVTASILALAAMALAFVAFDPLCLYSFCCGSPEQTTQERAQSVRSAAQVYRAQRDRCPTFGDLIEGEYLMPDASWTDAWGHTFWIQCDANDVTVRSCRFDGENILEPPE